MAVYWRWPLYLSTNQWENHVYGLLSAYSMASNCSRFIRCKWHRFHLTQPGLAGFVRTCEFWNTQVATKAALSLREKAQIPGTSRAACSFMFRSDKPMGIQKSWPTTKPQPLIAANKHLSRLPLNTDHYDHLVWNRMEHGYLIGNWSS